MPLILSGNVASATAGAYEVANSCRFNEPDDPSMLKTSASGNQRTFTVSVWLKRSKISSFMAFYSQVTDNNNYFMMNFQGSDKLDIHDLSGGAEQSNFRTTAVFRDTSAWYHIVCAVDTTQATEGNRFKIWVNGTQQTVFDNNAYPDQNDDIDVNVSGEKTRVGAGYDTAGYHFDGYLAEVCSIDGTAYTASDFGEFDEDSPTIWKPKDVSGLTFGTNGFYLDFEDSSNLGNDANGGTDLTETNLAATDQCQDSPTNNYNTMNPLVFRTTSGTKYSPTFSEGNTYLVSTNDSTYDISGGTFMLSSGKWYFEWKANGVGDTGADFSNCAGIKPADGSFDGTSSYAGTNRVYGASGKKCDSASTVATYGDTWTTNDIIGCYVDLDNYKIYFAKNGVMQNSADVSAGTGFAFDDLDDHDSWIVYTSLADFGVGAQSGSYFNFGNPAFTISSSNSDANGYGSFEYNPTEDGVNFYAINTKNLAEFG